MSQATILLMSDHARRGFFGIGDNATTYAKTALRTANFTTTITLECDEEGAMAAEEMFDLTNNPNRQDERERRYGRLRSISTGDIVRVDGFDYLCLSFGWTLL